MANRGPTHDPDVFTIEDLKRIGSKKLPKMYQDYFNEGAMDMITLRENEAAYNLYRIQPRILVNVEKIDTSSEIFGCKVAFPLGFSPTAMHKLAHPDGELGTSGAAAKANICMGLSSYSTYPLEEVAAQGSGNPYVLQMCILKDLGITKQLIARAEKAGYKAIFLSVDVPVLGRRLNEFKNKFILPGDMTWPNINTNGTKTFHISDEALGYDTTLEWDTVIPWLRSQTKLQLWLKGVSSPDDVELAIQHGLDGIMISNHGGRQLDGAPATLHSLRQCAPIAKGRIQIAVDGGIRRGSDIFKALALGAQHCFVGRIPIWGLAYKGQEGVDLAVQLLLDEFRTTMALAGCRSIKEISIQALSTLGVDGRLSKL